VVILTGAGEKAFCTGVRDRALHRVIREIPKPVIAAVNGLAVGGGHVLRVVCDLSIAADHARFSQAGPRVGSFDAGFGTNVLARVVGEKRVREIWMLCPQLMAECLQWADEMAAMSPTVLRFLKHSSDADTEHQAALAHVANSGLDLLLNTPRRGSRVAERRPADFSPFAQQG
jgi:2-ketocyclohexanecarboxyl-CoA hydrolase